MDLDGALRISLHNEIKIVINLDERQDRREEMNCQLQKVGWEATYFSAIKPTHPDGFPSLGARGCFLSHLEVLRLSIGERKHLIILEDDLNFAPDFSVRWPNAISELLTTEWSIFYPAVVTPKGAGLCLIEPTHGIQTAHFMVIHRDSIATIANRLHAILSRPAGHPDGGAMHVDGAYSTIRANDPTLRTYVYSPPLGYERSSRSDIANNRLFDRIPALQGPVRMLRKLKDQVRLCWRR
jgi:glycosyl transferase, family 25